MQLGWVQGMGMDDLMAFEEHLARRIAAWFGDVAAAGHVDRHFTSVSRLGKVDGEASRHPFGLARDLTGPFGMSCQNMAALLTGHVKPEIAGVAYAQAEPVVVFGAPADQDFPAIGQGEEAAAFKFIHRLEPPADPLPQLR